MANSGNTTNGIPMDAPEPNLVSVAQYEKIYQAGNRIVDALRIEGLPTNGLLYEALDDFEQTIKKVFGTSQTRYHPDVWEGYKNVTAEIKLARSEIRQTKQAEAASHASRAVLWSYNLHLFPSG